LAKLCHRHGKTLPQAWQNFVTGMAKLCHGQDKTLSTAGKTFGHGRKKSYLIACTLNKSVTFAAELVTKREPKSMNLLRNAYRFYFYFYFSNEVEREFVCGK
jgi:hypothetical protein